MRHRRRGRVLGRSSSHRKAMLSNLAASLFLTERDPDYYEGLAANPPKFRGRVVTTLHKAKEVRPLVEKCITIAKKALPHQDAATAFETTEERNSDGWRKWRESEQWQQWNAAVAPAVNARRRVFAILRDKEAVEILFDDIAPRFTERPGGYTRIMRLATPRLGDAGQRAILELVGQHDRVKQVSQKPTFETEEDNTSVEPESESPAEEAVAEETVAEETVAEDTTTEEQPAAEEEAAAEEEK